MTSLVIAPTFHATSSATDLGGAPTSCILAPRRFPQLPTREAPARHKPCWCVFALILAPMRRGDRWAHKTPVPAVRFGKRLEIPAVRHPARHPFAAIGIVDGIHDITVPVGGPGKAVSVLTVILGRQRRSGERSDLPVMDCGLSW